MIMHPYHGADGRLWPELDDRVVGFPVLCAYEGMTRNSIYLRALAGDYGRADIKTGAWIDKPRASSRGQWRFRPAVIWRLRGLGRYASIQGFDPRAVREPIFCCDPATTAQRLGSTPAQPQGLDLLMQGIAQAFASLAQGQGQSAPSVFPALPHILHFPVAR